MEVTRSVFKLVKVDVEDKAEVLSFDGKSEALNAEWEAKHNKPHKMVQLFEVDNRGDWRAYGKLWTRRW